MVTVTIPGYELLLHIHTFYYSSHKLFDRVVERTNHSPKLLHVAADSRRQDTFSCMLNKYWIHNGITYLETCIADKGSSEGKGMHLGCIGITKMETYHYHCLLHVIASNIVRDIVILNCERV